MKQLTFLYLLLLCISVSCSKHDEAPLDKPDSDKNDVPILSTIDGDVPVVPSDREKFKKCVAEYWGGVSQGYETVSSLSNKVRNCAKNLSINATNYATVIPSPGNLVYLPYITHVNDLLSFAGVTDPSLLAVPEQVALAKDYYSILNLIVQSANITRGMSPESMYNSFVNNAFDLGMETVIGYAPGDCIYPEKNLAYGYFHAVAYQNVDIPLEWANLGFEFYPQ